MRVQVITAAEPSWIEPFTGLRPASSASWSAPWPCGVVPRSSTVVPAGKWSLELAERVLLVAAYWRTNLTMRQIGALLGVSYYAAHRVIDSLGPLLALAPARHRRSDQIAIVDGTLVPLRDHRLAAPSKNYRYSANLQVAIDADTRLVIALGRPQPGNHNDCTAYRACGISRTLAGRPVMADGGYRGNPEVIMPFRKSGGDHQLPDWRGYGGDRSW